MDDLEVLGLCVSPDPEADLDELAEAASGLRMELLELDVLGVDPVDQGAPPEFAKGLAAVAGALVVRLGALNGLRAVIDVVRGWAARTNRTVEVNLGGDMLKLTRVTSEQQEKIIDAWLARHSTGS